MFDEYDSPTFDPSGNWCPDCGLPRGVCDCADDYDDDPLGIEYGMWANTPLGLDDDPDDEDNWLEYYDYTEGDVGQDGEI